MKLFTRCQVCREEGEVPEIQTGLFGHTSYSIPFGWWLIAKQPENHNHTSDTDTCPVEEASRFIVCSVRCVLEWARMEVTLET